MEKSKEQYGNLNKIKDVTKLGIKANHVLIEVVEGEKSPLLLPAGTRTNNELLVVKAVGEAVKSISVGDYVIDISGAVSMYEKNDTRYMITDVYNIVLYVTPDNYEG